MGQGFPLYGYRETLKKQNQEDSNPKQLHFKPEMKEETLSFYQQQPLSFVKGTAFYLSISAESLHEIYPKHFYYDTEEDYSTNGLLFLTFSTCKVQQEQIKFNPYKLHGEPFQADDNHRKGENPDTSRHAQK